MPKTDHYFQIGQVLKSNGTDGQLLVGLRGVDVEDISEKELVFIFFDELPVPYFMTMDERRGVNKLLVHMTDICSLEDAEEIVGKGLYMVSDEDEQQQPDLVGWTLYDQDGRLMGTVSAFEDIPGNPCLEIQTESSESVLVPLNEELVIDVNESARSLVMAIPEGLFQLR